MIVCFKDYETCDTIGNYETDFFFKVGQKFEGFWGCNTTVKNVELNMRLDPNDSRHEKLQVVQIVYVERVSMFPDFDLV